MYVGDTKDGTGLHHLLWEVAGNVLDLHLAGKATHLGVHLGEWVEVRDDGPGFPIALHPRGKSALEMIFTTLCTGPTYDGHFPHVHIAPMFRGVGLAPVNALSAELEVETRWRGGLYRQRYARGVPLGPVEHCGASEMTGSCVRFRPDPTIFASVAFDHDLVRERLRELAFLNPLMTVHFGRERFRERDGLTAFVASLAGVGSHPPIWRTTRTIEDVQVDMALTWVEGESTILRSFVSQLRTPEGGTHVRGFWEGLAEGIEGMRGDRVRLSVVRELASPGLVAVVHVGLYDPRFGSPTKSRLESPEARAAVRAALAEALPQWCRSSPELRASLLARF